MTAAQYERLFRMIQKRTRLCKLVQLTTKGMPKLIAAAYLTAAVVLFVGRDGRLLRFLAVPALALGCCLLLRRVIDRPRPYEVLVFQPLIPRDKRGQSCPSNHTVSAVVIALAFFYLSPYGGWMLIPAAVVALSRVVCGVHWPGDVLAAAGLGVLIGTVGFWIV